MTFEWDEEKEKYNIRVHDGISFSYAARVFLDFLPDEGFLSFVFLVVLPDDLDLEGFSAKVLSPLISSSIRSSNMLFLLIYLLF